MLGAFNNNTIVTDLLGTTNIVKCEWFNSTTHDNTPCSFGYCIMIYSIRIALEYVSGTASGKLFYNVYVNNNWQRWKKCEFPSL